MGFDGRGGPVWTPVTLASGWGGAGEWARDGRVVTISVAASKATYSAGETVATVPLGIAPTNRPQYAFGGAPSDANPRLFYVDVAGNIQMTLSGTGGVVGNITYIR